MPPLRRFCPKTGRVGGRSMWSVWNYPNARLRWASRSDEDAAIAEEKHCRLIPILLNA
jgi:hypothetical protein